MRWLFTIQKSKSSITEAKGIIDNLFTIFNVIT